MDTKFLPLFEPSYWNSFNILMISGLLWVVLYITKKILTLTIKRSERKKLLRRWFPLAEGIVWAIFVVSAMVLLILPNPVIRIPIIVILVAASWLFIRNFISGLIIRLQGHIYEGQRLMLNGKQGEIINMRTTGVDIVLEKGEIHICPYTQLLQNEVIQPNPSDKIKSLSMEFTLPSKISRKEVISLLSKAGLNLPWAVTTKMPVVDFLESTEDGNRFQLIVYAMDSDHFSDMEQQLLTTLKQYQIS